MAIAGALACAGGIGWWASSATAQGGADAVRDQRHVLEPEAVAPRPDVAGLAAELAPVRTAQPRDAAGVPAPAPIAAPLPPLDAPFAQVMDALEQRALQGDARAACRWALEHLECAQLRRRVELAAQKIQMDEAMLARRENAELRESVLEQRRHETGVLERLEQRAAHCDGVPPVPPQRTASMLRQAALAGHTGALKQYASGNGFRWDSALQVLPELEQFRREAESMALQVATRGDVEIWLALAAGYSPINASRGRSMLAQTLQHDPVRALAILRRVRDVAPMGPDGMPANAFIDMLVKEHEDLLSPEQLQRAERELQDLRRDWTEPTGPVRIRAGAYGFGFTRDVQREACAD